MNKGVLLSIQPKYCKLIADGEKTIEVRKNRPKIETPYKCYIYCTKNGFSLYGDEKSYVTDYANLLSKAVKEGFEATSGFSKWNGKIIGEFVCNEITCFDVSYPAYQNEIDSSIFSKSCMTYDQLHKYAREHNLYGWHISELKIYNKPKELSEFRTICKYRSNDGVCHKQYNKIDCNSVTFRHNQNGTLKYVKCSNYIENPPQSWYYVEKREKKIHLRKIKSLSHTERIMKNENCKNS